MITITVCADGYVSVTMPGWRRRLGAALPAYKTDSFERAMVLIDEVCTLGAVEHNKRIGVTLQPKAPNWPEGGTNDIAHIATLTELFRDADKRLYGGTGDE